MRILLRLFLLGTALLLMTTLHAQSLAPDIVVTKVVDAPIADVWQVWTTAEGIESFFASKAVKVVPEPVEGNRTSVTLRNFGYGDGEEWARTKAYFERAWPAVMANLEKRFAKP